jgi:DNA primase
MNLPQAFLDELLSRTSLSRLVARKVTWDRRRSNPARGDFWAPCPFHHEKTASFHVDEAKGFYYCFGCQAKGDAISFLRASENLGFMEAVEILAREAGMSLPERRSGTGRSGDDRRARLEAAIEAAIGFYRIELRGARGAAARAYLDSRGVGEAVRDRFEIGYAPSGWTALAEHLVAKGFREDEIVSAGLMRLREGGAGGYDAFRDRIMFPIRDARGRAVAFGGRALKAGEGIPKYLNSAESPLFDKGATLFNHRSARAAATRGAPLIVAEGYMDVIALVQAGFEAAVAPMGTAVTAAQLEQLWKMAPEPLIALDGDAAGLRAAHRVIDLALPLLVAGRSLRFVLMPPGADPDDVLRAGGPAAMQSLIDASQPIVELLWRRETEGRDLDSPERLAALDLRLRGHLERIADRRLRRHTARALAECYTAAFGAPARTRPPRSGGDRRRAAPAVALGTRASLLASTGDGPDAEARLRESAILLALLNHPEIAPGFEDRLERMTFLCPDLARIRDALLSCIAESLTQPLETRTPEEGAGTSLPRDDTTVTLPKPADLLAARMAGRLGEDPRPRLAAIGQLGANPHLRPGADPRQATRLVEEEIARHAAALDRRLELAEAEEAMRRAEADGEDVTWRLRSAIEAEERAIRAALAEAESEAEDRGELSRRLQEMIDREVWRKRRPKR